MCKVNLYSKIEIFHLILLRYLEHLLPKGSYALKGGCNLRFFLGSIRYSEGIDLDVWEIPPDKLQERVDKLLVSKDFKMALAAQQIELTNLGAHKQTTTTQRWKMALQVAALSSALPTKIEFSRREKQEKEAIEISQVSSTLTATYNLPPLIATHYKASAAFAQKLKALLVRRETQARDIFDLHHLAQMGAKPDWSKAQLLAQQSALVDRILALDFPIFSSQVVAFLSPDYQVFYQHSEKWEEIQLNLIHYLEHLP